LQKRVRISLASICWGCKLETNQIYMFGMVIDQMRVLFTVLALPDLVPILTPS
jgi:hypothetical protein